MQTPETKKLNKVRALRKFLTVFCLLIIGFCLFNYFYSDKIDATVIDVHKSHKSNDTIYTFTYQLNGVQQQDSARCRFFQAKTGDEVQLRHSKFFEHTIYTIDDIISPLVLTLVAMVLFIPIMKRIEKGKIILPEKTDPDASRKDWR